MPTRPPCAQPRLPPAEGAAKRPAVSRGPAPAAGLGHLAPSSTARSARPPQRAPRAASPQAAPCPGVDRKGRGGRIGEDGPGHGRTPSCQAPLRTRWGSGVGESRGGWARLLGRLEAGWGPRQEPVSGLRRRAGKWVSFAQRRLGSLQGETVENQPPGASGCSLRRCLVVYLVGDSHLAPDCWRPRAGIRGLRLWGHAYRDTFACRGSRLARLGSAASYTRLKREETSGGGNASVGSQGMVPTED